jgi:hypothetical protein
MSSETIPVFIVGSGRSGTRTIFKLLSGTSNIEIYHEFVCTHIQKDAAMYFMNLIDKKEIVRRISELHGSAIYYSSCQFWVDCSNKLSWVIEPLIEMFPNARFVNLVRDGRKVAGSFFHKLSDEMYDDFSTNIMIEWLSHPDSLPIPPPEKKYWWNIPRMGQPFYEEFPKFNQFQRACYQWQEANRVILESLKIVPSEQQMTVKLEELISKREVLAKFLLFFSLEYDEHFYEFLQTPQNVIFPMDFALSGEQLEQFNDIASDMMERLGYAGTDEYTVKY